MNVTLLGYYGFHNLGDDLMLEGILQALLERPAIKGIHVVVRENYYTHLKHPKVHFYQSLSYQQRLKKVFLLFNTDCAIWGGGTCLYEPNPGELSGIKNLYRNLKLFKLFGKPYIFYGIGIGTIYTEMGRKLISALLNESDHISFRDKDSFYSAVTLVKDKGKEKFFPGSDPVFLFRSKLATLRLPQKKTEGMYRIGFCGFHEYKDDRKVIEACTRSLVSLIRGMNAKIIFIPMHQGILNDNEFHYEISKNLPEGFYEMIEYCRPEEALKFIMDLDFLIGMRLHSIILADLFFIPNIALEYALKVRFYVNKSGFIADRRLIGIGESITGELVKEIAEEYKLKVERLSQFIEKEESNTQASLRRLYEKLQV